MSDRGDAHAYDEFSSGGDSSSVAVAFDDVLIDRDDGSVPVADLDLVRGLLESGSADAIVAEQAAKALERKSRHRDSMIRYRRKKKATLSEMKHEEEVLATRLQRMLSVHATQSQSYSRFQTEEQQLTALPRTAMDEFVGVVAEKEQLQYENRALRQQLEVFRKFEEGARDEYVRENQAARRSTSEPDQERANHVQSCWVRFLENEAPFYYIPYTEQECRDVASATLRKVFANQAENLSGVYNASTRVVNLIGWRSSLQSEWDEALQMQMIRYTFTKTFTNPVRSIGKLVDAHWKLMHSPKVFEGIYSVPVKSQVLQTFGDNVSVVISNPPTPDRSVKYRMMSIYARGAYRDPQGRESEIVTVTGVLPKDMEQSESDLQHGQGSARTSTGEPLVYAHGGFYFTIFMEGDGGRGIDIEYGGRITAINEETARFLMVELCSALVRMENMLSPLRVLQT